MCFAQEINLVTNGDFTDDNSGIPWGWNCPSKPHGEYRKNGGPNGKGSYVLHECDDYRYENKFRQTGFTLVPDEEYKLSCWVRTSGFESKHYGVIAINHGWFAGDGNCNFPKNSDWTYYETVFKCMKSSKSSGYEVIFFAVGQKGTVEVSDIKLIPLTAKAQEGSKPVPQTNRWAERLIPWEPALNFIPSSKPLVSFKWYGKLNGKIAVDDCRIKLICGAFETKPAAFTEDKPIWFDLSGLAKGWHDVTIQVLAADGKVAFKEDFTLQIRDIPTEAEATQGTRLNNMTVEYCNAPVAAGNDYSFSLAYDGWMYFAARNASKYSVTLDGKKIIEDSTARHEAFRFVEAGYHKLVTDTDAHIIVRTISDIFSCPVLEGPMVSNFTRYNWDFAKKWILPATTTCNRGAPSPEVVKECQNLGLCWTGSFDATNLTTIEDMKERTERAVAANASKDGVSADELFYNSPSIDIYTQALKKAKYDKSKIIYTWGCGKPFIKSVHTDFIATCLNASNGKGKIIYEAYCRTKEDEKQAKAFIDENIATNFKAACAFYPNYARRAGIILGNFNQIGVISLEHHPQVDFKYYLDMQMNLLANDPALVNIGVVGYWGNHYTDEEMLRWSYALLRHYVVEGKRDMLSKQYGFSYLPGHIKNNDFVDGFDGWKVEAAAEGSVKAARLDWYGDKFEVRWFSDTRIGDTYCHFKAMEGKANRITQTAKNLVPGKKYMLLCYVGDYKDIVANRFNPHRIGLDIDISDADVLPESFVWVDTRKKGYSNHSDIPRQNMHRIIFVPKASEVNVTFTDANANPGEEIMLNYIQLKPFFEAVEVK